MEEIKSAREIAEEKASKLGKLSPEEQRKQKEDRCRLIGKMLADNYLSGQDMLYLKTELGKYNNEDNDLISRSILHQLIKGIDLRKDSMLERISQDIVGLSKSEKAAKTIDRIKELFQEQQLSEKTESQKIESCARETLHQLGISGTAISAINTRAKEEWKQKLDELAQPFEERLEKLKQDLLNQNQPTPNP